MRILAPSLCAVVFLAGTTMAQMSRADDLFSSDFQARDTATRGTADSGDRLADAAEDPIEAPAEKAKPKAPRRLPNDPGYATAAEKNKAKKKKQNAKKNKAKSKTKQAPDPFVEEKAKETLEDSLPSPDAVGDEPRDAVAGLASPYARSDFEQPVYGDRSPSCHGGLLIPPARLFAPRALARRDIEVGGWLDQGFTANPADPQAPPFNGPVGFNDFPNQYQMNQLWVFVDRTVDRGGYGWDIGGHVDFNYGTDSRFIVANGLETTWNGATGFYDVALPQCYADVAYNNLSVRAGHFFTILGYEYAQAPKNFFYSHSYTKIYGQALTYTGMLATYDATDRLSVTGGFQRGWNQWTGNNSDFGFLGGLTYNIDETGTRVRFAVSNGNNNPVGQNNRMVYSIVYEQELPAKFSYVLQNDLGYENDALGNGQDAAWYSLVNYLFYAINDKWSVGVRYELFDDEQGARIRGIGAPKGYQRAAIPTIWQDLTLGVKYMHNPNLTVRSEVRWDWADPQVPVDGGPFNDFTSDNQFLWSLDMIVQF